jgi:hypothetical protein
MSKHIEKYGDSTRIEHDTLTDGSVVHNVLFKPSTGGDSLISTAEIRLGCTSEKHAMEVADSLESTCWSEAV